MNFYLLQLVGKWISFITLSILSLFNFSIDQKDYTVVNDNGSKQISAVTSVVEYKTIKKYNSKIPSNITKTITEGSNGLVFTDEVGNTVTIANVVDEVIEVGTGADGRHKGVMTGYGPDCVTCTGEGIVACRTKDRKSFNLLKDGIYYNDDEYGEVRVMAAALSKFPCGTIIEVESRTLGNFTGIVLDTGYDMRKNLERGINHFDIAYLTEKDEMVSKTTDMSGNVSYSVQRWGW